MENVENIIQAKERIDILRLKNRILKKCNNFRE